MDNPTQIELQGKYNTAKVFTDLIDKKAIAQIIELCNQEFVKDSTIRIMPDVHAGAGCVIGTTMTIQDKIVPNLAGVDIGCGMHTVQIGTKETKISYPLLDSVVRESIPHGMNVRKSVVDFHVNVLSKLDSLRCKNNLNLERAKLSIGTLGGGNHFIEVSEDEDENKYLIIHSGSRYLGKQVAEYYQDLAHRNLNSNKEEKQKLIEELRRSGRTSEIETELKKFAPTKIPKALSYLEGQAFEDYLHDMDIVQEYASANRYAIALTIFEELEKKGIKLDVYNNTNHFATIHNYIDTESMILRKGAVSAKKGEKLLIPLNMRDGSLLCVGKGNPDWNYSAPHGAGRLYSRGEAKRQLSLEEFEVNMRGVYSTSVSQATLDEAPDAYKPMSYITEKIGDTVDIISVLRPVYNFKAS